MRGRKLDYFWMRVLRDDGSAQEGHYARVDGFQTIEAVAMDRRYDDNNALSGNIFFFPYKENEDYCSLLVGLELFR